MQILLHRGTRQIQVPRASWLKEFFLNILVIWANFEQNVKEF